MGALAQQGADVDADALARRLALLETYSVNPATFAVSPNAIVLDNASVGANTGWLPTALGMERYGFNLLSGASAGITIDGSNDGLTSAGQVATVSLDTTGSTFISGPIKPLYPFIRFTVSSGAGVAQIARGM